MFVKRMWPDFIDGAHHKRVAEKLDGSFIVPPPKVNANAADFPISSTSLHTTALSTASRLLFIFAISYS